MKHVICDSTVQDNSFDRHGIVNFEAHLRQFGFEICELFLSLLRLQLRIDLSVGAQFVIEFEKSMLKYLCYSLFILGVKYVSFIILYIGIKAKLILQSISLMYLIGVRSLEDMFDYYKHEAV